MIRAALGYYLQKVFHKGKRHVARVLFKMIPVRSVRGFYGVVMCPDANDKTSVYGLSGEYGRIVSDHLCSIPDGDVFLDIGTNHGVFSLMVASRNPRSQVISFEPNPAIYRYFLQNIALNGVKNIVPFHGAVGPQDGLIGLWFDPKHSGKAHISNDTNVELKVPMFNLAQMPLLNELIGVEPVHIKIDVEGFEMDVLQTLLKAPWFNQVQTLVLEIDDKNLNKFGYSAKDIYEAMNNSGFGFKIGEQNKHYDEIFVRVR